MYPDYARKLCLTNFASVLHLIEDEKWKALKQSRRLAQKGSTSRIKFFANETFC